jgi:uroporphyrin-III C-methyltransferase
VPGLSSAIAAPALSGIPATHRSLSSAFVVVSGHAEEAWRPVLAALPPASATVVVLMGLGSRGAIARVLAAAGWRPSTPAAVLWGASTPQAQRWLGTLARLDQARAPDEACDAPGTIVAGDVVSLATAIGPALEHEERGEVNAR